MSEFGVQSFPMPISIARFAKPEDESIMSPVMMAHQKSSIGNEVIDEYIRRYYRPADNFRRFVYLSQVMQGAGIRLGIEAQRAAFPYCGGSLYWQLNDAWPAVSWSAIDYYGQRKALHYEARRAFAPIILVPSATGRSVKVVNGSLTAYKQLTLSATPIAFDGHLGVSPKPLWHQQIDVPQNGVTDSVALPMDQLLPASKAKTHLLLLELTDKRGHTLASYLYYALPPKDLSLPSNVSLRITTNRLSDRVLEVEVQSTQLVRSLYLSLEGQTMGVWSDNFFDLLPHRVYKLRFVADDALPHEVAVLTTYL